MAGTKGYEACTGCSLCLLVCPVWRATRDIRHTPHGRAKALQHGATVADLAVSIDACTLCGACEPACPENIALVALTAGLRTELARLDCGRVADISAMLERRSDRGTARWPVASVVVVAGRAFAGYADLLQRTVSQFGQDAAASEDDGADISLALESGIAIPDARRKAFLDGLRSAKRLVVGDGMLLRALREWLPQARIEPLGATLVAVLRDRLRPRDLYVIEPRGFHADQERLVKYYHAIGVERGLFMNLDLQRMAIGTTAGAWRPVASVSLVDPREQARWILEGHAVERVVVEDPQDIAVFATVADRPVLHLSQLG